MRGPRGQMFSECSGPLQEFLKDSVELSNCNNPDMVPLFHNNTWSPCTEDNSVDRSRGILQDKPDRNTNVALPSSSNEVELTIETHTKSMCTNGARETNTFEDDRQGDMAECSESHGDFIDRFGVRWVGDCRIFELMAPKQGLTGVHRNTSTNSGSRLVNPFGYDSEMVGPCSPGFNCFEEEDPKGFGGHNKVLCDDRDFNTRDVQVDSFHKSNLERVKNSHTNCQKETRASSYDTCSCICKELKDGKNSPCSSTPNEFSRLSGRTGNSTGDYSPLWSSNRSACNSFWGVDDPLDDETACSEEGDRIMLYKDLIEETDDPIPDSAVHGIFHPTRVVHKDSSEQFGNLGQISAFSSNLLESNWSGENTTFPLTMKKGTAQKEEAVEKPNASTREEQHTGVVDRHGIQWFGDCRILMKGVKSSPGTLSKPVDEMRGLVESVKVTQGLSQDGSAPKNDGVRKSKIMDHSVLHNTREVEVDEFPKSTIDQTVDHVHIGSVTKKSLLQKDVSQDTMVELQQPNNSVAVEVENCTKSIEIQNSSTDGYKEKVLCDSQLLEYDKASVLYNSIRDNFHCTKTYLFSPVMYFLHHLGDCSAKILKKENIWFWSKAVPKSLTNVSTMCWGIKSRLSRKCNT